MDIAKELGIDHKSLMKDWSYLAEHGLTGLRPSAEASDISVGAMAALMRQSVRHYFTDLGEDYMRELEKKPGIAQKITTKTFAGLWKAGHGVIVSLSAQLLAEYAKHHGV